MAPSDISRDRYETLIQQGIRQFLTYSWSDDWEFRPEEEDDFDEDDFDEPIVFCIDCITESEAFPSLLEILRTHDTLFCVSLIGHGKARPSPVDDAFLEALLQNPHLGKTILQEMVISSINWNRLKALSTLHDLSLFGCGMQTSERPRLAPQNWSLARSLKNVRLHGNQHSLTMSFLEVMPGFSVLQGYGFTIENEHQALALEKVLTFGTPWFVFFLDTNFIPQITEPILRGLDQSSSTGLIVSFAGSCRWNGTEESVTSPSARLMQAVFFDRLSTNLRIEEVDIGHGSHLFRRHELQAWFACRAQYMPLIRNQVQLLPGFWPVVLEHVLQAGSGADLVFLLVRNWPPLVPWSRKRVRSRLTYY